MKVICPIEGKDGKTHWHKVGVAFGNRDGSTNIYLNSLPTNGKLQLREYDEERRSTETPPAGPAQGTIPF